MDKLVFYVNGKKVVEEDPDPELSLLQYLRLKLQLTGPKLACGEGACGACTVMISGYDRQEKKIRHWSANACLTPVCAVHGLAVTTVEGIGSTRTRLHPVQERLAKAHGVQCGFCTPGMVMSMYTLLRNDPCPDESLLEQALDGNLCRCTGYRPILEGFKTFTKLCGMGADCCQNKQVSYSDKAETTPALLYDPTQEPIFPSELQLSAEFSKSVSFNGKRTTWYQPVTLDEVLQLRKDHPDAVIVAGNTDIGLKIKFEDAVYSKMISINRVEEMTTVTSTKDGLTVGGSVTLGKLQGMLKDQVDKLPESQTRVFAALLDVLPWFASTQMRNAVTLGGVVMSAATYSDINPVLMAAGCEVTVASKENGQRQLLMDENFFLGSGQNKIGADEVLVSVHIPFSKQTMHCFAMKQGPRKQASLAIINTAMKVVLKEGGVEELVLCFGNLGQATKKAKETGNKAIGRKWNESLVEDVTSWLKTEMKNEDDITDYKQAVMAGFFFKFFVKVSSKLEMSDKYSNVVSDVVSGVTKSTQVFESIPECQSSDDAVGRPLVHNSAFSLTTGEAMFVDDIPCSQGELHLALVTSPHPHAKILEIDSSGILDLPGVVDFICHKDVPVNIGGVMGDEQIYQSNEVHCIGNIVAGVVADTRDNAQRAAKAVKIKYEEIPAILTMKPHELNTGNVEDGFKDSDDVLEGEFSIGGQKHMYMEPQTALVVPSREKDEMKLYVSTQDMNEMQKGVAKALDVQANKIMIYMKRAGGGFGGKQSASIHLATCAAVAARKSNRPVRCVLNRQEDFVIVGHRHPVWVKYKIGFTKHGKILALKLDMCIDGGYSKDKTEYINYCLVNQVATTYNIPNRHIVSNICKTNNITNTPFRGLARPQGAMINEKIISEVALKLGLPGEKICELNMYKSGDAFFQGSNQINGNMERCWEKLINSCELETRKEEISTFNMNNKWKKRGYAVQPLMYGLSFGQFNEQGAALINVYRDGSVLLTHMGLELGQGLHTKMIQVASRALGISPSYIHTVENSTSHVPNGTLTAASLTSDIAGGAVMDACKKLKTRLEPFKAENPDGSWPDWVEKAYLSRVSLSATGFFKTDREFYNPATNTGTMYMYFSYGAGFSMVEIDCLTGDHKILRTDIVMDVGKSLNPAIDIGQIEGGFLQGAGLYTLEEIKYAPNGQMLTTGPLTYKIPSVRDVPTEFNVSIMKESSSEGAVYSSKAISEPPLLLGASVFLAIQNAIVAARADCGVTEPFHLNSPATAERIRMACKNKFSDSDA